MNTNDMIRLFVTRPETEPGAAHALGDLRASISQAISASTTALRASMLGDVLPPGINCVVLEVAPDDAQELSQRLQAAGLEVKTDRIVTALSPVAPSRDVSASEHATDASNAVLDVVMPSEDSSC